jgi:biopolymer transport protein ExbD
VWFQKQLQDQKEETSVNLTPLIDVSLVLVVILLLATPFALESSIAVQRSGAAARQKAAEERLEYIELSVVSEDSVEVNRREIPRNQLAATLTPLLERSSRRQVVVRCSDQVSHGTFVDVLDLAKLAGAAEIAVMGR